MKHFFNILFYVIASVALGLGIGSQVAQTNHELLMIIPYIVAGVFYVLAIIMSATLIHSSKSKRNTNVTLQKKDIILQMGQDYTVSKRGKVRPGEYQVLATDENDKTFNLRVNDYVKEYKHNTTLVLAEGDTISARSAKVILR